MPGIPVFSDLRSILLVRSLSCQSRPPASPAPPRSIKQGRCSLVAPPVVDKAKNPPRVWGNPGKWNSSRAIDTGMDERPKVDQSVCYTAGLDLRQPHLARPVVSQWSLFPLASSRRPSPLLRGLAYMQDKSHSLRSSDQIEHPPVDDDASVFCQYTLASKCLVGKGYMYFCLAG